MFGCIIFDVDGTLIDTEAAVIKSLQRVLNEILGKEFTEKELEFVLGIPGSEALKKLGIPDIEEVNDRWNRYMYDFRSLIKVFDGIEEVLKKLKDINVKTGIVTSKTYEELESDFKPFGLMKYLDFAVCADDTKNHKPHPEPIQKFLEISGSKAGEAIYIGDTQYDMECARGANVKFALAAWGAKKAGGINTDYIINNPDDILDIIKSNKNNQNI